MPTRNLPTLQLLSQPLSRCISQSSGMGKLEDGYGLWAWTHYHRSFIGPWALCCIAYAILLLRDMEGFFQRCTIYVAVTLLSVMAFLSFIHLPAHFEAHSWARRIIVVFFSVRMLATWLIATADGRPGDSLVFVCSWWLDIFTHLLIAIPTLALADMSTLGWFFLCGMHFSACIPFYVKCIGYSVSYAALKVLFTHVLALFIHIGTEKSRIKAYMKRGYLQKAPAAHLKSPFEEKEQQIRTTGDVLEEQTDLPAHLLHDISPSHKNFNEHLLTHNLYIPKAERSQVYMKINADIAPRDFEGNAATFFALLHKSLPGTRTSDAAVRYGCIILSLDLCGMPSDADMRIDGMKEYLLARNVALEWLQSLVPTEQLLQKPINIQVNQRVFRGLWDAATQRWDVYDGGKDICADQCTMELSDLVCVLPRGSDEAAHDPGRAHGPGRAYDPGFRQQQLQPQGLGQECAHGTRMEREPRERNISVTVTVRGLNQLVGNQSPWIMDTRDNEIVCTIGIEAGDQAVQLVGRPSGGSKDGNDGSLDAGNHVQLLAHMHGMFLPVTIAQQKWGDNMQTLETCVTFPFDITDVGGCSCLKLELVWGSSLLCCCTMMVVDHAQEAMALELRAWCGASFAAPCAPPFLQDLAEFLSFQGLIAAQSRARSTSGLHSMQQPALHTSPTSSGQLSSAQSKDAHARRSGSVDLIRGRVSVGPTGASSLSDTCADAKVVCASVSPSPPAAGSPAAAGDGAEAQAAAATSSLMSASVQALLGEACQPKGLAIMTEMGLDLLQYAVCEGMAAVAERVLHGLMDAPFHIPFQALVDSSSRPQDTPPATPCRPQPPCSPAGRGACPLQSRPQHQQHMRRAQEPACTGSAHDLHNPALPPPGRRSLLTAALLSQDSSMVARVLQWGCVHGGPAGFAWALAVQDEEGLSPTCVLQCLPEGMLRALQGNPLAHSAGLAHAAQLALDQWPPVSASMQQDSSSPQRPSAAQKAEVVRAVTTVMEGGAAGAGAAAAAPRCMMSAPSNLLSLNHSSAARAAKHSVVQGLGMSFSAEPAGSGLRSRLPPNSPVPAAAQVTARSGSKGMGEGRAAAEPVPADHRTMPLLMSAGPGGSTRDNPNSSPSLGRNWWQCAVALILLLAAVNAASSGPSPKVAAYAIGFLIQVLAILNHLVVLPILCKDAALMAKRYSAASSILWCIVVLDAILTATDEAWMAVCVSSLTAAALLACFLFQARPQLLFELAASSAGLVQVLPSNFLFGILFGRAACDPWHEHVERPQDLLSLRGCMEGLSENDPCFLACRNELIFLGMAVYPAFPVEIHPRS